MKGYMYILECSDGSYYTGSTTDLERRLAQHQNGEGANHTKKRLPVKLVYFEEYSRIDEAFYREKQVQGWSRKKKEALIKGMPEKLHELAKCMNESSHQNYNGGFDSAQPPHKIGSAQPPKNNSSAETPDKSNSAQRTANKSCLSEAERCLSEAEGSVYNNIFKKLGI
jgi:putative endonuclease